jgi:hypothetical protein
MNDYEGYHFDDTKARYYIKSKYRNVDDTPAMREYYEYIKEFERKRKVRKNLKKI